MGQTPGIQFSSSIREETFQGMNFAWYIFPSLSLEGG
jgi:hypothetical protein